MLQGIAGFGVALGVFAGIAAAFFVERTKRLAFYLLPVMYSFGLWLYLSWSNETSFEFAAALLYSVLFLLVGWVVVRFDRKRWYNQ